MSIDDDARDRHNLHKNHASSRPLSADYELVGIAGEQALADAFGTERDRVLRPGGDGGTDAIFYNLRVDVKAARKPFNLIVERGKVRADIFVLGRYDDATKKVTLLGWETGGNVKRAPVKDFGYGVMNHHIAASKLRSMDALHKVVELWASLTEAERNYARVRATT